MTRHTLGSVLFLIAATLTLAGIAAAQPLDRQELRDPGPNEGMVVGSVWIKGGRDLLGRVGYDLAINKPDSRPLFSPDYTVEARRDGEETVFAAILPAGVYHITQLRQTGFSNFARSLTLGFRVQPGRITYIGRLLVEFPDEMISMGTRVRFTVEDARKATADIAKSKYGRDFNEASVGLMAATPLDPAPTVATGAVEFREMQFTLPAGQWERSSGSPPSSQVTFMLKQEGGRAQALSIWRTSYPKSLYGLAPEEHTTNVLNYEQFGKQRPVPWVDFARSNRSIGGKEHPVMTYQWHHPSVSNPEAVAHGILLIYFPEDFRRRERFYVFQWSDVHPPSVTQQGWEWLDQVVASFTVGPVQE